MHWISAILAPITLIFGFFFGAHTPKVISNPIPDIVTTQIAEAVIVPIPVLAKKGVSAGVDVPPDSRVEIKQSQSLSAATSSIPVYNPNASFMDIPPGPPGTPALDYTPPAHDDNILPDGSVRYLYGQNEY